MEFMIIAFRSRSQTMNFANILRSYKVDCSIINTPRVINVSCGISIRFSPQDIKIVESIMKRRQFDSYGGIYHLKQIGNKIIKI